MIFGIKQVGVYAQQLPIRQELIQRNMYRRVVVINRSFYPGWQVYLGNNKLKIYPANINQQAVIVPESVDWSQLKLQYDPWTYKVGGIVSTTSIIVWILLLRKFRYNSGNVSRN